MPRLFIGNREITPAIVKPSVINNQDKTITENGVYTADEGYTGLGEVTVNVPNVGIPREVSSRGVYEMPTSNFTFSLPSNAVDVGPHAIDRAFQLCGGITSVDLSNLTNISGSHGVAYAFNSCGNIISVDLSNLTNLSGNSGMYHAFDGCGNIISVDLSSLSTISGNYGMAYAFNSCLGITSVDLPSLSTISGNYGMYYTFGSCNRITSVNLSSLSTISGNYGMFYTFINCSSIVSVDFSNLTTVSGSFAMHHAFSSCTSLTFLSFPALTSTSFGSYTNQFNNMLYEVTGCTVHFPSNLQSVIGSWSDVTAGFGGTNTTVLFDLPATT